LSKNSRGQKEYSRLQEALHENKKLKREISSLRKQLARLDLDRHDYVKDIIEEHLHEETPAKVLEAMKEEWKCKKCNIGYLEIVLYTKVGDPWYFRKCNFCPHRTTSKQYFPDKVEGIVKGMKSNP
jgi:hypothetical protein